MQYVLSAFMAAVLAFLLACNGEHQNAEKTVNVDDATRDLNAQIATSPNSASLHYQLGALLAGKGDWAGSDKEMSTAMQLGPHDPTIWIGAAQGYRARGQPSKAVEMLHQAVAIDSQNPLSHFSLGVMYERQSDSDKATAEFRETKRLIDTLSLPSSSPDVRNRIVKGTRGESWYVDQFGKDYLLDQILGPLRTKLSK